MSFNLSISQLDRIFVITPLFIYTGPTRVSRHPYNGRERYSRSITGHNADRRISALAFLDCCRLCVGNTTSRVSHRDGYGSRTIFWWWEADVYSTDAQCTPSDVMHQSHPSPTSSHTSDTVLELVVVISYIRADIPAVTCTMLRFEGRNFRLQRVAGEMRVYSHYPHPRPAKQPLFPPKFFHCLEVEGTGNDTCGLFSSAMNRLLLTTWF